MKEKMLLQLERDRLQARAGIKKTNQNPLLMRKRSHKEKMLLQLERDRLQARWGRVS